MEERKKIIDSIIEFKDNEKVLDNKKIKLEYFASKYSSTKEQIWQILYDDKKITKKSTYKFKYKCNTCSSIHIVNSTQFIRRINNGTIRCYLCRNLDEEKRKKQSVFLNNNPIIKNKIEEDKKEKIKPIMDFIKNKDDSIKLFEEQDDDYKELYFKSHLTVENYNRILNNLKSFENGKLCDLKNYEFWPIYKTNNQMLFTSVLFDKVNKTIFKANQPILKCDNCDNLWRAKSIEKFKNDIKIYCKDCSVVNKVFNLKPFKNINDEKILYQSKLELKLIKTCNDNNILIKNGPKIEYNFNNKNRTYKVDFQIGKKLIEVKDEHIWHKREVESGKWEAKEKAAKKYIEDNKLEQYIFLTPKNWIQEINKLIKI